MADETLIPDDPGEQALRSLVEQTTELARRVPGGVRRLSVRAGDHAVEIEWDTSVTAAGAPPAASFGEAVSDDTAVADGHYVLTAPLVGAFYRAPEPGAAPFVEEGDVVEAGQVVAIIEAMKIMNSIETERAGKVSKILASNGDVVEFGQELMMIEPYEGG